MLSRGLSVFSQGKIIVFAEMCLLLGKTLLSARLLRLNEYFSTDNVSFCVSFSKVGSYTGNPNDKEYPHRSTLICSSHSSLLPTGNYICYNIFLISVNFKTFLICSFIFKVTICLFILFDSSGCVIFLLVWDSNQGACLTKPEFEMCTKAMASLLRNFTELYTSPLQLCVFLARWFQRGRHFELKYRFYNLCISSECALWLIHKK